MTPSCRARLRKASFDGDYLRLHLREKASAYLFHIFLRKSQPFLDGNKRTVLACRLVFRRLNGYEGIADLERDSESPKDLSCVAVGRSLQSRPLDSLRRGTAPPDLCQP